MSQNLVRRSSHWSEGNPGKYGVEVHVSLKNDRDLTAEESSLASRFCNDMIDLMIRSDIQAAPDFKTVVIANNNKLIEIFGDNCLYVETIPNPYDRSLYHPWLIVTTPRGRIKIGRRSKVINIDWSGADEILCKSYAIDIFPAEESTRLDHAIHAWDYQTAASYVQILMIYGLAQHSIAQQFIGMPESQKNCNLRKLKQINPNLYALVRSQMDDMRR